METSTSCDRQVIGRRHLRHLKRYHGDKSGEFRLLVKYSLVEVSAKAM